TPSTELLSPAAKARVGYHEKVHRTGSHASHRPAGRGSGRARRTNRGSGTGSSGGRGGSSSGSSRLERSESGRDHLIIPSSTSPSSSSPPSLPSSLVAGES